MKITLKVTNVGDSLGILLPSQIVKIIGLEKGSLVELDINKLNERETKHYFCRPCSNHFDSNDEMPSCNICENEAVEELENE